jgi:beta-fructofuranosidase
MVSEPYDLTPVIQCEVANESSLNNKSVWIDYSKIPSGAMYFQANVSGIPTDGTAMGTLNFTFSSSETNESVSGGYFFGGDAPFWINRGKVNGFDNPFFTDKFSVSVPIKDTGMFMLEGIIDRSILEVFLHGGEYSATNTFFPQGEIDRLLIGTAGLNDKMSVQVKVWALKAAWAEMASSDGLVHGNTTAMSS